MTIKKIAKLAGVSIGTVDRVIHGRGRVAKETELKIKKIIKKYGYKPNIFASNLSLSRSYVFGIVMPFKHQDSKYWDIADQGIQKAINELKIYNIDIKHFFYDRHDEKSFENAWHKMIETKIDGLLIAPTLTDLSKFYFKNRLPENIPISLFDSFIPDVNHISYIGQDSYQSGVLSGKLMKMLVEKKANIAVIRVIPDDYHINQRVKGFKLYFDSYKNYKISIYDVCNSDNIKEIKMITDKILNSTKNIDGIFVTNAATHHVAKNIRAANLDKKIFLIGYDLIGKNIHYLNEGVIDFLISQKPEFQGYQGIYTLYRSIVLKEKVEKKVMMPIDIITKENIKYYIE